MKIENHIIRKLDKIVGDEDKMKVAEYIQLVLGRKSKPLAYSIVYPKEYKKAIQDASGNKRVIDANITKAVNKLERSKVCRELYAVAHKHFYIQFISKKLDCYETLYEMGNNEENSVRDRTNAIKVLLDKLPQQTEQIDVNVTVDTKELTFEEKLKAMQSKLLSQSKVKDEDIIEVEVNGSI